MVRVGPPGASPGVQASSSGWSSVRPSGVCPNFLLLEDTGQIGLGTLPASLSLNHLNKRHLQIRLHSEMGDMLGPVLRRVSTAAAAMGAGLSPHTIQAPSPSCRCVFPKGQSCFSFLDQSENLCSRIGWFNRFHLLSIVI